MNEMLIYRGGRLVEEMMSMLMKREYSPLDRISIATLYYTGYELLFLFLTDTSSTNLIRISSTTHLPHVIIRKLSQPPHQHSHKHLHHTTS